MLTDITSANAKLILTCEELYPSGVEVMMFSTNQAVSSDALQTAETRMGVDGHMAAGYVPNIKSVTVQLEASSPSRRYFQTIHKAMIANQRIYKVSLTAIIPSIGEEVIWSEGVLQNGSITSTAARVLEPTSWVMHFEKYERSAYNA
jgi:hypothetical protein